MCGAILPLPTCHHGVVLNQGQKQLYLFIRLSKLTRQLTPWPREAHGAQLIKKIPAFYETERS